MKEIIIYTHEDCILKNNGKKHPENKKRLQTKQRLFYWSICMEE